MQRGGDLRHCFARFGLLFHHHFISRSGLSESQACLRMTKKTSISLHVRHFIFLCLTLFAILSPVEHKTSLAILTAPGHLHGFDYLLVKLERLSDRGTLTAKEIWRLDGAHILHPT